MKSRTRIIMVMAAALFMIPALVDNDAGSLSAQGIAINNNAASANASSMLDISSGTSANRGLLVPRVTFAQRTGNFNPLPQAAQGLTVYQTDAGGLGQGYYYNTSTTTTPNWVKLGTGTSWDLLGNAGTTVGTNFIGTTDAVDWVVKTNNTERMRVLSSGNVGIGTAAPAYRLDLGNGTFGFGSANQRTETRDNAGLQGNAGAQSGFFETASPTNYPSGASSWWHLIDCRHSNTGNNYALQIAGSFWGSDLYYRKTADNPAAPWKMFVSANNSGTTGQILVSQGAGNTPVWQNPTSVNMYGNNASSVTLSNLVTTVNTTTWEDIAGMSITFTPSHSVVYLFSSLCARLTDNSSMAQFGQAMVKVRMLVNGVEVAKVASIITDYDDYNGVLTSGSVAFSGVRANVTVGAATTVKLQWYVVRLWSSSPWRVEINPGLAGVADHCVLTVFD